MIKEGHGWQTQFYDSCSLALFSVLLGRQQPSPGGLPPLVTAVVNQVVPGESCCLLGLIGTLPFLLCNMYEVYWSEKLELMAVWVLL